jgi:hypothetical protein
MAIETQPQAYASGLFEAQVPWNVSTGVVLSFEAELTFCEVP